MSRYSSDSDSSSRRHRSRKRRSRSSSSSSSSNHRRSKKTYKHHSSVSYKKSKGYSNKSRRRSRSGSRSRSRNSRSLSKDRRRRRSRDRYRSKHHHKSRSHSKGHSSRYHSRSSSNETRSRQSKSPVRSNSSSSSSSKRTSVAVPSANPNSEDQLREKLLKAIKAAESADHQLKQQGVLPKGIKSRNDLISLTNVKPQCDVIKAIEKDEFIPKTFTSSKTMKASADDELPEVVVMEDRRNVPEDAVNSIFHASFFCDPKVKLDRWVKKLYQIRQKAISGEPILS